VCVCVCVDSVCRTVVAKPYRLQLLQCAERSFLIFLDSVLSNVIAAFLGNWVPKGFFEERSQSEFYGALGLIRFSCQKH